MLLSCPGTLRQTLALLVGEAATLDAAEAALADLRKRLPSSHWESLQDQQYQYGDIARN